jgi:hypothetical protein
LTGKKIAGDMIGFLGDSMKLGPAVAMIVALTASPALAESELSLNGGAATIVIPSGDPQRLPLGGTRQVLAELLPLMVAEERTSGDKKGASPLEGLLSQLDEGEGWNAEDGDTHQSFSVFDFPVAPSISAHPDCRGAQARSSRGATATCRILKAPDFEAAELVLTTSQHASMVIRAFAVGDRFYVLSHQIYPSRSDNSEGRPPPSDDQVKFFESFRLTPTTL